MSRMLTMANLERILIAVPMRRSLLKEGRRLNAYSLRPTAYILTRFTMRKIRLKGGCLKLRFVLGLLLAGALWAHAQPESLFAKAPTDWREEVIPFPLGFAPSIDYQGVEELRFSPGAFKAGSEDFFAYAFVWALEGEVKLSEAVLQKHLLDYYKGLYLAVSKLKEKNTASFAANVATTAGGFIDAAQKSFAGKVTWQEPFATEKPQVLNLLIDVWFCAEAGKTLAFFLISPQPQEHAIWTTLKSLAVQPCDAL